MMTFHAEIRPSLDKEQVVFQHVLDLIKEGYEAGFSKVELAQELTPLPLGSYIPDDPHDIDARVRVAKHREIAGIGGTAMEALEDWLKRFKNLPRQGDVLFWRVRPEVNWWYDFPKQKASWKVYARLAVFE